MLAFLEGGFARQRHVAALIAGLHKTAFSDTKADDSDRVLNEELRTERIGRVVGGRSATAALGGT